MRPIDADEITATLEIAISMMENTKSIIDVENLPVIDVEIKAYTDILKGIKEQPTVQPEPQWIPVSERLPEEPGYYITSNEYNGVGEDFYYDGHFWNADKNAYSVIAWMPKPKAYKSNK